MIVRAAKYFMDMVQIKRNPTAYARRMGVSIGEDCRLIGLERGQFGSEPYLITLGNHVTITSGVRFITHDGGVWVLRHKHPDIDAIGSITVEDNTFIGMNSILMPNIVIGENSIVAAGSVVTKDVPPNSVVGGSPARLIRTIDEYEERALKVALHVRGKSTAEKRDIFTLHAKERRRLSGPKSSAPQP